MDPTLVPWIVLSGVALLAAVGLAAMVVARRRQSRLHALCRKHDLGLIRGAPHDKAVELARRYASQPRRVKLADILAGHDDDGAFYVARRHMRRRRHHSLFCEIKGGTHVEGFHVEPVLPRKGRGKNRPTAPSSEWSFDLRWRVPRVAWTEGRSLGVGARVLGAVARLCDGQGAVPIGIEIHHRNLIVHSTRVLSGDDLDRFVEDAIHLRRQVLAALRAVEHRSDRAEVRRSRPISASTNVQVLKV